jgi:protein-S-isoprenylcysteine O-methyltransferase Ste14
MKANILSMAVVVAALCVLGPRYLHQPWPPFRIAGAVIAFASLSLIVATRLVTTGLYARIRNPIYTFGCFFFLGLAMFIPAWWLLLLLIVVIPLQIARARREAAVLEATFGDEYRQYRRQTWF